MFIFLKAAHSMEENDFAKLCLKKLIALQSAYSSPAESGIMEDLGLSIAAVSINISFIFCNINKWYMYIYIYIYTHIQTGKVSPGLIFCSCYNIQYFFIWLTF